MSADEISPAFDARIATALVVGPLLPLVLYSRFPMLLLPTLLAATIIQFTLPYSQHGSRRRMVLAAGSLGLLGVGWPLYVIESLAGA